MGIFSKKKVELDKIPTISEQLTTILVRLGKLEAENITIHDKIDKLETRTRKDKEQRPKEELENKQKGVFLRPDGTFLN